MLFYRSPNLNSKLETIDDPNNSISTLTFYVAIRIGNYEINYNEFAIYLFIFNILLFIIINFITFKIGIFKLTNIINTKTYQILFLVSCLMLQCTISTVIAVLLMCPFYYIPCMFVNAIFVGIMLVWCTNLKCIQNTNTTYAYQTRKQKFK